MAQRGGGRSELEPQQAAARQEAERDAREQARLAKQQEKEAREQHILAQQHTANEKTSELTAQIAQLDDVLISVLGQQPFGFHQLKISTNVPAFVPGALAKPGSAPKWVDYAPAAPGLLGRIFGRSAYQREVTAARARWQAETARFERTEADRLQALKAAEAEHARSVAEAEELAATHNAGIAARQAAFAEGDPEAVEWFVGNLLDVSRYPDGFPNRRQIAYRPEHRDVVLELELPSPEMIPEIREYKYIKTRDEIKSVSRTASEIKKRYARLVACVTLRTLHEIFTATPPDIVAVVVFNGLVSTVDRATGQDSRPPIVSVQAERSTFTELDLPRADPAACLKRLNAVLSPNPLDLEAVEPFIDFDLKRFRVNGLDELADLDSRQSAQTHPPQRCVDEPRAR